MTAIHSPATGPVLNLNATFSVAVTNVWDLIHAALAKIDSIGLDGDEAEEAARAILYDRTGQTALSWLIEPELLVADLPGTSVVPSVVRFRS